MAEKLPVRLPTITPEQRRVAAGQFERANQVIATGNHDYGIQLLLTCCKLDPASLTYRQALRKAVKAKYRNNLRGSSLAFFNTFSTRISLKKARRKQDHIKVLEYAEKILRYNPWDNDVQLDMAQAFDSLGLLDNGIWTLDQARQKNAEDAHVNRALARLYEKRGNFTQAIALWQLVRKVDPRDNEAQHKVKDLAAESTIQKGRYEEAIQRGGEEGEEADDAKPAQATPGQATEDRAAKEVTAVRARIKADPTNANAYLQLANAYRRAEQVDKAREVLREAASATGNHFEVVLMLAELDIEPLRKDLLVAEKKLRQDPGNAELVHVRTKLYQEVNARELEIFRKKSDRFPTEMAHRFEIGQRLLRIGQVDEAIRELQASRTDPRLAGKALMCLGHCFKTRNNWRLAQRNFEEALQLTAAGEEAMRKELMFQLAQGHAESGDLAKATEIGLELANLDFNYKNIGRLLDDWQARMQKA